MWRRRTADRPRCTPSSRYWRPLRLGSSCGYIQHLRYEVGQNDPSRRRESGDTQARLTRAGGDVEMLMIFGDVETLDDRCAHRAQLIHDDRVPLFPAGREPRPRRSLGVSDLVGARHRPSRSRHASGRPHPARACRDAPSATARDQRTTLRRADTGCAHAVVQRPEARNLRPSACSRSLGVWATMSDQPDAPAASLRGGETVSKSRRSGSTSSHLERPADLLYRTYTDPYDDSGAHPFHG